MHRQSVWRAAIFAWAITLLPALGWARSKEIGWVGLSRNAKVEGVYGSNTYTDSAGHAHDGSQLWVSFEGGMLAKISPLGNVGGIEGSMMLGYDGAFSGMDNVPLAGAFAYNFAVGFPFTVFHQYSDNTEKFQLAVAPGFGVDYLHAYLYLKGKAAYLLSDAITLEASHTWWPGPTSLAMSRDNIGFNLASTKGSVYIGRPNGTAFELFAEHLWGEEETEKANEPGITADPKAPFGGHNPFTTTTRRHCCSTTRLGAGIAF